MNVTICLATLLALSTCSSVLKSICTASRRVPQRNGRIMRTAWSNGEDGAVLSNFVKELIQKEPIVSSLTGSNQHETWLKASKVLKNRFQFIGYVIESSKYCQFGDHWIRTGVEEARKLGISEHEITEDLLPYMERYRAFAIKSGDLFPDIHHQVSIDFEIHYLSLVYQKFSRMWNSLPIDARPVFRAGLDLDFRSRILPQAAAAHFIDRTIYDNGVFYNRGNYLVFSYHLDLFNSKLGPDAASRSFQDIEAGLLEMVNGFYKTNWNGFGITPPRLFKILREIALLVEEVSPVEVYTPTEIE